MSRNSAVLTLIFFISIAAFGAGKARKTTLRDGFVLAGVDGKLRGIDSNDVWLFEFDSDVGDGSNGFIKAGAGIKLLPSSALERMIADTRQSSDAGYRLWGRITRYKGKNFIFPNHFMTISKTNDSNSLSSRTESRLIINEPNDVLAIPEEIAARVEAGKIARAGPLLKTLELELDFILTDKTGFVRVSGHEASFVPDGLGRSIGQVSFALLACEALERAERIQSGQPRQIRFKTAGIVTRYKGQNYLLLQKATRVYSYGNFDR